MKSPRIVKGRIKQNLVLSLILSLCLMLVAPVGSFAGPVQIGGQLVSTGNIVVNSNSVGNGATILSPSLITVPAGVQATINLGAAGKIDLKPGTFITLEFTDNSVNVKLHSGGVTLTLSNSVAGEVKPDCARVTVRSSQNQVSIRTADKTETLTQGKNATKSNVTSSSSTGPSTFSIDGVPGCGGGGGGTSGGGTGAGTGGAGGAGGLGGVGLVVIGGGVAAGIVGARGLGNNSSDTSAP